MEDHHPAGRQPRGGGRLSGDAIYPPATFAPLAVTVGKASTTTTIKPTVAVGQAAGFEGRTADVSPATGPRTGTTRFTATASGQATVVADRPTNTSGRAIWKPVLPEGRWTVTAEHLENDTWFGSTSAELEQVVGDPPPAEPVVDQEESVVFPGGTAAYNYPGYQRQVAQTFTAGVTGTLTIVGLAIEYNGGTTAVQGSIETVVDGVPSGTVLSTFTPPTDGLGYQSPLVDVALDTPVPIVAGTQYAIVLGSGPLADFAAIWGWTNGDGLTDYAGGDGFIKLNADAYASARHDFRFLTKVLVD